MKKTIILMLVFVFCIFGFIIRAEAAKEISEISIGSLSDFEVGTIKPFPQYKIIIFSDKDGIYCISTKCTHMGCLLAFKKDKNAFICPCHGAAFSKDGVVGRGPAKKDLAWYSIKLVSGDKLVVDKNTIVPVGTKFKFNS